MLELDVDNTLEYLRQRHDVEQLEGATVQLLGWGVSNVVLRVNRPAGHDLIIKQSRAQLRTKANWFSRLDRIYREIGMLHLLRPLLPEGVIPAVYFEDRDNYLFGMEAFPAAHTVWKGALLNGDVDQSVASRLGDFLAAVHSRTAYRPDLAAEWGDLEVFDQLRLDPFYRYLAAQRTAATSMLNDLVAENLATRCCMVLADFSPKNILLAGDRIAIVDFETGHYGDPAFDLGFFLSHLLLKAVRFANRFDEYWGLTTQFWTRYWRGMSACQSDRLLGPEPLWLRTQRHLAACMWARVDGKSPVDYLNRPSDQELVREFCLGLLQEPAVAAPEEGWSEVRHRLIRGLPPTAEMLSDCPRTESTT